MWTEIIEGLTAIIQRQAALIQTLTCALAQHEAVDRYEAAARELEEKRQDLLDEGRRTP